MKRHGNARLESGGSLILIGDSPDSVILGGLLESRRWKGVLWRFQGRSYTELVRTPSIATAVSLAKTKSGVTIVCSDPDEIERAPLDRDGRSVPIVSELTLIEQLLGRVPLDLVRDDQWVEGARTRLASGRYVAAKRAIDLTAGLLAGLLLLPVIVLTALVVWAARGRPLLCTFPCVGRDDRVFGLHLFRTDDSACPDDPTVMFQTPSNGVWRFLRQNHLHLLPSIWNLIRGDLALIGPRPEAAAIVPVKFHGLPNARFRHLVRPGLISLAQVRFRYSEAPRDTRLALEYDLFYVRHADFAHDAKIFLRGMMIAVADSLEYIGWGVHASLRWCWTQAERAIKRPGSPPTVAFPRQLARSGASLKATLIVGSGSGGKLIAKEMRGNPQWGYWPVGFIDDDLSKLGTRVAGLPVVGATGAIPAYVRREQIDAVVIAIPSAPDVVVNRIAELARQSTAQVLRMPHIGEALYGQSGDVRLQAVRVTDVLGRDIVMPDMDRCRDFIRGRRVLITGAAGSIGREVARQVAKLEPAVLIGLDVNESDLFDLQQELISPDSSVEFSPVIASITNRKRLESVFSRYEPEIVFHAAAYKHVPMMEEYPLEAVWSNTVGTYETARVAAEYGVKRFILVSSDKAVRPSSVMGATKRLAEIVLREISDETGLSAGAVRFGNVLGSRGSVIPIFERQIAAGGPITITDPRMKRYFMTIPEAAGLIIQAGAFGDRNVIYMLDMGEEVAIKDLAERMIRLHGLRVGTDIEIVYTGLRPGEKLREELSHDFEQAGKTPHPKIRVLANHSPVRAGVGLRQSREIISRLTKISDRSRPDFVREAIMSLVAEIDGGADVAERPIPIPIPAANYAYIAGKAGD